MAGAENGRESGDTADQPVRGTLTDPAMIRALSHPARLAIVEHLGSTGAAATATELAGVVGLSPSATSYHLRAMARLGLVEQAESRGDGRERMWRVVGGGWTLEASAAPERRTAERALLAAVLARSDERIKAWFSRVEEEPAEWSDEVAIFDSQLLVTDAEMAEINAAYQELLRPYLRRNRPDAPAGARVYSAQYRVVPST
jgi:DNA-binding transcriptional ArsR family regulator